MSWEDYGISFEILDIDGSKNVNVINPNIIIHLKNKGRGEFNVFEGIPDDVLKTLKFPKKYNGLPVYISGFKCFVDVDEIHWKKEVINE